MRVRPDRLHAPQLDGRRVAAAQVEARAERLAREAGECGVDVGHRRSSR
jgi:hypothetical protein